MTETETKYLQIPLPVIIEKDNDGYFVFCPAIQGCYSQGDTYEEALKNIKDAISLHIDLLLDTAKNPNIIPNEVI